MKIVVFMFLELDPIKKSYNKYGAPMIQQIFSDLQIPHTRARKKKNSPKSTNSPKNTNEKSMQV